MTGKAKPKKHTAKEIARKTKEATLNKGGGKGGIKDRKGGKAGHSKMKCHICMTQTPSLKSMEDHFSSKHDKLDWNDHKDKFVDTHKETGGVTTQGINVKGTKNTAKIKKKAKSKK